MWLDGQLGDAHSMAKQSKWRGSRFPSPTATWVADTPLPLTHDHQVDQATQALVLTVPLRQPSQILDLVQAGLQRERGMRPSAGAGRQAGSSEAGGRLPSLLGGCPDGGLPIQPAHH